MFKQLIAFSFFSVIAFVSCQKDMAAKENPAIDAASDKTAQDEISVNSLVSSAHWYGGYTGYINNDSANTGGPQDDPGGDPDINPVSDAEFIRNGVAELPYNGLHYSYTNITFDIPSQYNFTGDSLTFQAVVENPVTNSINDYDVVLQMFGDQHTAEVHFVKDTVAQSFTRYYVGNSGYTNLASLVNYFSTFKTIKWVFKKDGTATYVNGKLAYRFNYGSSNRIGRLLKINLAGKGYIIVNSVKLLNSYNNKKILVENFNIDGQSHTVFY